VCKTYGWKEVDANAGKKVRRMVEGEDGMIVAKGLCGREGGRTWQKMEISMCTMYDKRKKRRVDERKDGRKNVR
jgi:hypothetical protein